MGGGGQRGGCESGCADELRASGRALIGAEFVLPRIEIKVLPFWGIVRCQ